MFVGVVALLFLLNFFAGSSKNANIARNWIVSNIDTFKRNFALVGVDDKEHTNGPYLE